MVLAVLVKVQSELSRTCFTMGAIGKRGEFFVSRDSKINKAGDLPTFGKEQVGSISRCD
jgi:hypothetical protein